MAIRRETVKDYETEETQETIVIPVCDFCGMEYPDEDASFLNDLVLNPEWRNEITEEVIIPMDDGFDNRKEVVRALHECERFIYDKKPVMEMDSEPEFFDPWEKEKMKENLQSRSFDTDIRDGVISYQFMAQGGREEYESRMEVCDNCKGEFKNGN